MACSLITYKKGRSLRVHFLQKKKHKGGEGCVMHLHNPIPWLFSLINSSFSKLSKPSIHMILAFIFTPVFFWEAHLLRASTLYATDSQNEILMLTSSPKIYSTFPFATSSPQLIDPLIIKMCSKANSRVPSFRCPLLLNTIPSQCMALAKS